MVNAHILVSIEYLLAKLSLFSYWASDNDHRAFDRCVRAPRCMLIMSCCIRSHHVAPAAYSFKWIKVARQCFLDG